MQVINKESRLIALGMLTVKQQAIADTVADMASNELVLTATAGKGAARKVAISMVADAAMADVIAQYRKGGCVNVAPFARHIQVITGQFVDGKTLAKCPASKAGFFGYASQVLAWANGATSDKTAAARMAIHAQVDAVIRTAQATADAYAAEQAADNARTIEATVTDVTGTAADTLSAADAGLSDDNATTDIPVAETA